MDEEKSNIRIFNLINQCRSIVSDISLKVEILKKIEIQEKTPITKSVEEYSQNRIEESILGLKSYLQELNNSINIYEPKG